MNGKNNMLNIVIFFMLVILMGYYDYSLAQAMGDRTRIVGDNVIKKIAETSDVDSNNLQIADPMIINQQNEEQQLESSIKLCERIRKKDGLVINERKKILINSDEKKILYRIVEAEAGGEDFSGRMLVANVIINRMLNKEFPDTVKDVVFSHCGNVYQFSPVKDGRYYSVHVSSATKRAVKKALEGFDNSSGAKYFICRSFADSHSASWFDRELNYLFKYGCHEFFS